MSEKSKVIVVKCINYEEEKVYNCLRAGIEALGGIEKFVKKDEKILVKPNFLSTSDADKAIVTHPSVIKAMLRLLSENGYGHVIWGDSPGSGSCKSAASKIGLSDENTYGAKLADMSQEVAVDYEEGRACKKFYFAKEVTEVDAVINLCKMKTHALEIITGGVKNVYGLIAGARKSAGHVAYPNASMFARMLCDIHRYVKPRLHIMDGIIAMEGNGPGSGVPTPMNVLLFSEDPVAMDTVFCYLVNLDPRQVPTNTQGYDMGIGTYLEDEIEIVVIDDETAGRTVSSKELLQQLGNEKFDVDREHVRKSFLGGFSNVMTKIARKPHIIEEKCIKCGVCVAHCPVAGKALDFKNGKNQPPVYDYSKCIRCYCCQEMCPQKAIVVTGKK